MENQIYNILNDMAEFLNVMQMKKLQKVLIYHLNEAKQVQEEISNEKYLEMFLTAKQIEGCSDRTIQYYRVKVIKNAGFILMQEQNFIYRII